MPTDWPAACIRTIVSTTISRVSSRYPSCAAGSWKSATWWLSGSARSASICIRSASAPCSSTVAASASTLAWLARVETATSSRVFTNVVSESRLTWLARVETATSSRVFTSALSVVKAVLNVSNFASNALNVVCETRELDLRVEVGPDEVLELRVVALGLDGVEPLERQRRTRGEAPGGRRDDLRR